MRPACRARKRAKIMYITTLVGMRSMRSRIMKPIGPIVDVDQAWLVEGEAEVTLDVILNSL